MQVTRLPALASPFFFCAARRRWGGSPPRRGLPSPVSVSLCRAASRFTTPPFLLCHLTSEFFWPTDGADDGDMTMDQEPLASPLMGLLSPLVTLLTALWRWTKELEPHANGRGAVKETTWPRMNASANAGRREVLLLATTQGSTDAGT